MQASIKKQLDLWVKGESVHNNERTYDVVDENDNVIKTEKQEGGECCPDFSCCHPELKWDEKLRMTFYEATLNDDQQVINSMLMASLSCLMKNAAPDLNVAFISEDNNQQIH